MIELPRATAGRSGRSGTALRVASWVGCLAVCIAAPVTAQLQPDEGLLSVAETEALVRARYYEGMPRDLVERIGPEGCEGLLALLGDPGESRHHDQVLIAIGVCAPDGALEAIDAWLAGLPQDEIDRPRFKAWLAVSHALAALADRDLRAIDRLEERMLSPEAPGFRHGRHAGARLQRLQRDGAATGLAESGLPEALGVLDRAQLLTSDVEFVAHLQTLRTLHRERAAARTLEGAVQP